MRRSSIADNSSTAHGDKAWPNWSATAKKAQQQHDCFESRQFQRNNRQGYNIIIAGEKMWTSSERPCQNRIGSRLMSVSRQKKVT